MLTAIQNEYMKVTAEDFGAQMQSIRGKSGIEYLWQGDPSFWSDRALNLFPYIARLPEQKYSLDGKVREMQIHGIVPYKKLQLVEATETKMTFELKCPTDAEADNERVTLEDYPRKFTYRITYELEGKTLAVTIFVQNEDEKPMYFAVGGHPGFNVPLEASKKFEDYELIFSEACHPEQILFSDRVLVNGKCDYPLSEDRKIALRHDLFDGDAIVLEKMAHEVTLEAAGSPYSVTVGFPKMPFLGIWHWPKKAAPYVCLEPWGALPSNDQDEPEVLEEKKDLTKLSAGEIYKNKWTIRLNGEE